METKEMIEVMQAYERGEQIEYRLKTIPKNDEWDLHSAVPTWNWRDFDYRVKPKPKYRPYKDAKEFLEAQERHGMWLESSEVPGCYFMPIRVFPTYIQIGSVNMHGTLVPKEMGYKELLETYHWKDGQKCGIKLLEE